ncbi:MAG: UbiA family prenyltransferase [Chloroherpetonaceae bacterium]|nr:UbiA family prenyltransferase [Chthonomonadaceae bacterium]MDW8208377.1 UbiA family prenyltransferase [Chloroherpetonaceae bacterium]
MDIAEVGRYWKHLRVPFQLLLSPLFLWGAFLSAAEPDARLWSGFVAFHGFLYTGITAYNSSYDRDEGPVGGMLRPPPVPTGLRTLAWVMMGIGTVLAACVALPFLGIYLTIMAMGVAYSHPRVRWKAHPVASALTVLIGQGALGFLGGWVAAAGTLHTAWSDRGLWGMLSAAGTTLGMYPLTQIYQIEEDMRRGDRTLTVVLGPAGALRLGQACLVCAAVCAVIVVARTMTAVDTMLIGGAYLLILWQVERFTRDYQRGKHTGATAFRAVMRLNATVAAGFVLFIALHVLRRL